MQASGRQSPDPCPSRSISWALYSERAYTWSTTKKYFIAAASPPPRSGHHGTPPPPADVLNCLSSAPNWISESSEFDIREIEMVSRSK
ncbi:hypothetical protein U9M48_016483 [Paspalum notatum var. saurae]|uniref:Uncharacterized protein n=1 Tax=Paspalum notatum var. saurae TaxID=547442 RepID=A0AAQ3T5S5_PASNO